MKEMLSGINVSAVLIDILLIIVILSNITKSAKQGFIGSIIRFALLIASYILVLPISKYISKFIYDEYLKESIVQTIHNKLINQGFSNINNLGEVLNDSMSMVEKLINCGANMFSNDMSLVDISLSIADNIVFPMINIWISIVILAILSLIISLILKLIGKALTIFSYIPILGKVNILLGGIFGFFKSMIAVILISMAIDLIILVSDNQLNFLNNEIKNETYVLRYCNEIFKSEQIFNIIDKTKTLLCGFSIMKDKG